MPNTLRIKRGLAAGLPNGSVAEPLFTIDTYDLYIGKGDGTNQRFQKYIASGVTTQIIRGDGSLYTFPLNINSPSNGQVLKYNGTSWVNDSDAGITGSLTTNYIPKATSASTIGDSSLFDNGTALGVNTTTPQNSFDVIRGSGGVMNRGQYESASFSYNGDAKLGVYSSATDISNNGASVIFGNTQTTVGSLYTGGEVQYLGNTTIANSSLRFSFVGRNSSGVVTSAVENALRIYHDGRIVMSPTLSGAYVGASTPRLIIGTTTDTSERLQITGTTRLNGNLDIIGSELFVFSSSAKTNFGRIMWDGTYGTTGTELLSYNFGTSTYQPLKFRASRFDFYPNGTTSLVGIDSSGNLTAVSFVKSGGTSTQYLMADGSTSTLTNPVTGTGTTNYLPKFTGASTIGNSQIFDNGTNVGIGTASPTFRLDITTPSGTWEGARILAGGNHPALMRFVGGGGGTVDFGSDSLASTAIIRTSGTERARIDSSGNLGLGVTPSAWGASYKALQIGNSLAFLGASAAADIYFNAYYDGTNFKYITSTSASLYSLSGGQHRWYNAAVGTAGNNITFTQAMTLDASGRFGLGTTTTTKSRASILSSGGALPVLGQDVPTSNLFLTQNNLWGLYLGLEAATGKSYIQSMRNDSAVSYPLLLQPVGGNILLGTTTDNGTDRLQVSGSVIATTLKKSGGTSSQLLAANGDSITAGTNITISGGTISTSGISTSSQSSYTPTFTNVTNMTSTTNAGITYFIRVGNVVYVNGTVNYNATTANVETKFAISLPVASNLANQRELTGIAATSKNISGVILGDTTNDRAEVTFLPTTGNTSATINFSFSYIVI